MRVRACVCACVRACVRVNLRARARVCVCVFVPSLCPLCVRRRAGVQVCALALPWLLHDVAVVVVDDACRPSTKTTRPKAVAPHRVLFRNGAGEAVKS